MQYRIDKLRSVFPQIGIDSMLIMKPENRRYISGFTGSAGVILVTETEMFLITDFRYTEQAAHESKDFKVILQAAKITDTLKDIVNIAKCKRIGFEKDFLSYANYEVMSSAFSNSELIPTENITENLRSVKDADEISLIKQSIAIADAAFSFMCNSVQPGMTELEAALELEFYMRKNGSQKNSFPPIVASGPRASLPHAQPTDREIMVGDMVKMDFGATYGGYCSDLTRTLFVGKVSDQGRSIYQIVLEAQLRAIDAVKSGIRGADVDRIARDYITEKGYGNYFGHGLGHGVGLYIHESPGLSQTSADYLQAGNIVTVEPGIYIPGWGGVRIEDMLVVTETGYENMTCATKELIII